MSKDTQSQQRPASAMLAQNHKQNQTALAIGKDKSVVSREVNWNADQRNGIYKSDLANRKYKQRQEQKNRAVIFTISIKNYVEDGLNNESSPQQISGRARLDGNACVSRECIYQYIWKDKKQGGHVFEKLRHTGRKCRKRGNSKDK